MECFEIRNLSFAYPNRIFHPALRNISVTIGKGQFVTLCGKSGCGKTTFLRLLKSALAPYGRLEGDIFFEGKPLGEYDTREQAAAIGFVMQNPDNQIVTDKVWHELAFGLESLGLSTPEIRARVSEMASFFGIQTWFHKNVTELSGGQKQLLNLAAVMVMQPSVLILDEPTSQLDPIAAGEFISTLQKINRELGTTVILSEHRLEDAFPASDRVIVMDSGAIVADGDPATVGAVLKGLEHHMYSALPAPMRIYGAVPNSLQCPVTVREGRLWLEELCNSRPVDPSAIPTSQPYSGTEVAAELRDVWFRYERDLPDVLKGMSIKVHKGELFAIVGGNGTGKTTALSLISGINKPYRGQVLINGKSPDKIPGLYDGVLGVLPQNPQSLFVKKTVRLDLMEMLSHSKITPQQKEMRIRHIAELCRIDNLLDSHPYDLSGGEQQRAALAKVLLKSPQILLLDEPTKGIDAHFKAELADILSDLRESGVAVVMVSHDIEFCAEYADTCALMFDGGITSMGTPREFFAGKSFYTTAANRMARTVLPSAVLAEDVIAACGGSVPRREKRPPTALHHQDDAPEQEDIPPAIRKLTPLRMVLGGIFAFVFALMSICSVAGIGVAVTADINIYRGIALAAAVMSIFCFFPQNELGVTPVQQPVSQRRLAKRTLVAALMILLAIPLTIYIGIYFLGDRKYYFISLLIMAETMLPFCMAFETRKPQARELVIISVLCAIAVAGRTAFFMLPQFKPVVALVIIAGVCFGGETGFLVGAVTGFVSNFFFGQGPWTPWQMFCFGIIGFAAGLLFRKGMLRKTRTSLCIFGFVATLVIYGGIMNPSSVIMVQSKPTWKMLATAYASGLPLDVVHAASTAFFLWFISEAMIDKLERIKVKYGLIER